MNGVSSRIPIRTGSWALRPSSVAATAGWAATLTVALSRTRSAGRLPPAPGRELGGLAARPGVDSSWMPRPLLVRERDHVLNER